MNFELSQYARTSLVLSLVLMIVIILALSRSRAPKLSLAFLIGIMICQMISQIKIYLFTIALTPTDFAWLRWTFPLQISVAPLVFLYATTLARTPVQWRDVRWYHMIPFLIGVTWALVSTIANPNLDQERYVRTVLNFLVLLPYFVAIRYVIRGFREHLKNSRSDANGLKLPWLQFLLSLSFLALLLSFFDVITGPQIPLHIYRGIITNLGLMGLMYFGLKTSALFEEIPNSAPTQKPTPHDEIQRLSDLVIEALQNEKLYLQPQLRLSDLADHLNVKTYKISEAINRGLNTNFYDLINGMRIDYAIQLMRDPSKNHFNLLGIANESGFNSKSVFNDLFRRKTGKTPSEYRLNP